MKVKKISAENVFKTFNLSKNNKLNIDEFANFCRDFFTTITNPEIKLFYKQVDKRGKQFISFDDFNAYFKPI